MYTQEFSSLSIENQNLLIRIGASHADYMLHDENEICCKCKKFKHGENDWRDYPIIPIIEANIKEGIVGNISHGQCPPCYEKAKAEIDEI